MPENNRLSLEAKNKFSVGDELVLLTPDGNTPIKAEQMFLSKNNQPCDSALGSGYRVDLEIPASLSAQVSAEALQKGLIVRNI